MPILAVTATKPRVDSKLGVTCNVMDASIVVKVVDEDGIFGGTYIERGQEVLRINETCVQNIGIDAIRALLASLSRGEVTFVVK